MPNQQGNGRSGVKPDEDQDSWRPQDENGAAFRSRHFSEHRDDYSRGSRYARDRDYRHDRDEDDERYMSRERERMGPQWDDRSAHWDDREGRQRSTEYYGQGQSGYGAGRYEGDRAFSSRNVRWNGDERDRDYDERFEGRSSEPWSPQERGWSDEARRNRYARSVGHYSHPGRRSYEGGSDSYGGYLGQGGQEMGEQSGNRIGSHRGKGPVGFARSDERIRELVCEVLTDHHDIDATNIEVQVKSGEVTLLGTVEDRRQKRLAEDAIAHITSVKDVINQLRIGAHRSESVGKDPTSSSGDKRHRA
jgi:osmotically-inducible protein OsmY